MRPSRVGDGTQTELETATATWHRIARVTPRIRAALQTGRFLWLSLIISTVLFLVVFKIARNVPRAPPDPTMVAGVMAMALVSAGLSVFFPPRAFVTGLKRLNLKVTGEAGEPIGSFRESAPQRRVVADPEGAVHAALPLFQRSFLVGMALAESVALLGFELGYIGAPVRLMMVFFGVAWILMASKLPRVSTITKAIERATGAECRLP